MLSYQIKIEAKEAQKERINFSDFYLEPDLSFISGSTPYETNLKNGEEVLVTSSINTNGEMATATTQNVQRMGTVQIIRHYPISKDNIFINNSPYYFENKIVYDYIFRNGKYYYTRLPKNEKEKEQFIIDGLIDKDGKEQFIINDLVDENGSSFSGICGVTDDGKMARVPETYWIEDGKVVIDGKEYVVDTKLGTIYVDPEQDDYENFFSEKIVVNVFPMDKWKNVTKFRIDLDNKQPIDFRDITYGQYFSYVMYNDTMYPIEEEQNLSGDGNTYFYCTIDKYVSRDGNIVKEPQKLPLLYYNTGDSDDSVDSGLSNKPDAYPELPEYKFFSAVTHSNVVLDDIANTSNLYVYDGSDLYNVQSDIQNSTTGYHLLVYTASDMPQVDTNDTITFEYGGNALKTDLDVDSDVDEDNKERKFVAYNGEKYYIEEQLCNKVLINDEEYDIMPLSISGGTVMKNSSGETVNFYAAFVDGEYILLKGDSKAATDVINEGISSSKLQRVSYSMIVTENGENKDKIVDYKSVEYPLVRHDGVKINNAIYQVHRRHYPVKKKEEDGSYVKNPKEDGLYVEFTGQKILKFNVDDIRGSSMLICTPIINVDSYSQEEIATYKGGIASEVFGMQQSLTLYTHHSIAADEPIVPSTGFGSIDGMPNDSSHLYDPKASIQIYKQSQYININIPNSNRQANNLLQQNLLENEFYNIEKEKAITPIVDMERDVYYPAFKTNENESGFTVFNSIHTIVFNLHFRSRNDVWKVYELNSNTSNSGITNWFVTDVKQYDELIKKNNTESIDKLQRSSDLLGYLYFTNNDVFYQKNKIARSFLRISFYDSINPQNQILLSTSTVFLDEGELYMKYIAHQKDESQNYEEITSGLENPKQNTFVTNSMGVYREPVDSKSGFTFNVDYRLDSRLTIQNKYKSDKSSEGFYAYIFREYSSELHPKDIYMKVEFNHAGIGKTMPMVLPMKWKDGKPDDLLKLSDKNDLKALKEGIPLNRLYQETYIPFECKYDRLNRKYVYYPKEGTFDSNWTPTSGGTLEFNLFELKIKDESEEKLKDDTNK